MSARPAKGAVIGLCHCCEQPVRVGEERREVVERGTGAAPEVLLHRQMCRPSAPCRTST